MKCTGVRGAAESGKTWVMEYVLIYSVSKGLTSTTTSHMARRAIQLGGKHIAYLFGIPHSRSYLTVQRGADLALMKIMKKAELQNFLRSLDILFADKFNQTLAEMLGVLDIVFRNIKKSNTYMGGTLIIFTMDHLQTSPVKERPLLTSSQIIPCFQMLALKFSVRAADDVNFRRIQEIARMTVLELITENNDHVKEFINLVSNNCMFVENWEDDVIDKKTYRLYSKKVPAKAASKQYADRVRRCIPRDQFISRTAEDVEKSRFSHSEWYPASSTSVDQIELLCKEPTNILFFKGGHYEFTYNKEDFFSQSQLAIIYDIPTNNNVSLFKKLKVLCAPYGIKDFTIDTNTMSKQDLIDLGFKEISVGVAPD